MRRYQPSLIFASVTVAIGIGVAAMFFTPPKLLAEQNPFATEVETASSVSTTNIFNPRVNHRVEPVGVESVRWSWNLHDPQNGTYQKAYRLRLFSDEPSNRGVWDSGWVESSRTVEIAYDGPKLAPSTKYGWTVAVRNNRGEISELAKPASFITGWASDEHSESGVAARWISTDRTDADPLPLFRKSFRVDGGKKITLAVLHLCGLGHYEARLNGENIGITQDGERFIDPGWMNYRKTCLYSSFDLTDRLVSGENVLGVILGNGMYNVAGGRYVKFTGSFGMPKLIGSLVIRYDDGSMQTISTDETWLAALGPITFSCVYGGEDVDHRREQPGWDRPEFDESAEKKIGVDAVDTIDAKEAHSSETCGALPLWRNSSIVEGPGGVLRSQEAPPVVVAKTMMPESLRPLDSGGYVADFGYNFSGRPRIVVRGKPGQTVTVTTSEIADRIWDGHSYTLTLRGEGDELILPKFSYFGFQFLYIQGAVRDEDRSGDAEFDKPALISVAADFTTSAATACGTFSCSDDLLNEIDAMIDRSVRSNLQSVVTDCPHREKLGWLEVPHLMGPSILYRYDVKNLYQKICRDMRESQLENGLVPDISPEYTRFSEGFFESPEWGSAVVQIPALLETFYGDTQTADDEYDTMKKYVEYLDSTRAESPNRLVKPGLGDWYDWSDERGHVGYSQHTPRELTATAIFIDDLKKMIVFANRNGRFDDEKKFHEMLSNAKDAYKTVYCDSDLATKGSQAAPSLSYFVVEDERKPEMLRQLVAQLESDEFKPTVGEVSFVWLIRALVDGNRDDVLWKIIARTDKPGYGYMLRVCGMKTLSETWDGPGSSMNHCMFGHGQEWFTGRIVGIGPPSNGHVTLAPTPVGSLVWACGDYDSVFGRIESEWKIEGDRFLYHCVIPTNLSGTVRLPTSDAESIRVNGEQRKIHRDAAGNSSLELENGLYDIEYERSSK